MAGRIANRMLKKGCICDSERSGESAVCGIPRKKQIPRAQTALGMTTVGFQQRAKANAMEALRYTGAVTDEWQR